jgi:hypothetical protein
MKSPDIVYFLKTPLPFDEIELKYSLRSLKNIPHGKVFMVTPTLPDIVDPNGVEHVSHLPAHNNKYADLGEKWKWLGTNTVMTDNVTYMDDDYFIIRPITCAQKLAFQPLWLMVDFYTQRQRKFFSVSPDLLHANQNTLRLLEEKGIEEPMSPHQHYPYPVERSNIPVNWEDGNGPYDWKILEFNHNYSNPPQFPHENKMTSHEGLVEIMKRSPCVISTQDGIGLYESGVLTVLSLKFPERSEYERA